MYKSVCACVCVSSWGSMGFGGLKFRVLGSDLTSGGVKTTDQTARNWDRDRGLGFYIA